MMRHHNYGVSDMVYMILYIIDTIYRFINMVYMIFYGVYNVYMVYIWCIYGVYMVSIMIIVVRDTNHNAMLTNHKFWRSHLETILEFSQADVSRSLPCLWVNYNDLTTTSP